MIEYIFQKEFILQNLHCRIWNASQECDTCHYWYFTDIDSKYKCNSTELYLCNDCQDLMQKTINFNDVVIVMMQ